MSAARKYHFVLTLQWTAPNRQIDTDSQHGTVGLRPGATNDEVLTGLIERMRRGRTGDPVILFFRLEENEIGGAS